LRLGIKQYCGWPLKGGRGTKNIYNLEENILKSAYWIGEIGQSYKLFLTLNIAKAQDLYYFQGQK
jgi:hypothetical protein